MLFINKLHAIFKLYRLYIIGIKAWFTICMTSRLPVENTLKAFGETKADIGICWTKHDKKI